MVQVRELDGKSLPLHRRSSAVTHLQTSPLVAEVLELGGEHLPLVQRWEI